VVAVTYAKQIKLRKGRPAFPDGSIRYSPIHSKARIVLLADWGSGIPRAEKLAQTVSRVYCSQLSVSENCTSYIWAMSTMLDWTGNTFEIFCFLGLSAWLRHKQLRHGASLQS